MIIDTDVLVWHLRGNEKARDLVSEAIPFKISVVTYMELLQGMRNKKELNCLIRQLVRWEVEIVHINRDISIRAMIYMEQFLHSHSMALADALIAATCTGHSELLISGNERHYLHIPDIQLKKFTP